MIVLVSVASVTPPRLRISHGIQDARKIRLQHLDTSHPHAPANHPQPARRAGLHDHGQYLAPQRPVSTVIMAGPPASRMSPLRAPCPATVNRLSSMNDE
jgi:hypothetical protein